MELVVMRGPSLTVVCLAIVSAISGIGCVGSQARATRAANAVAIFAERAHGVLSDSYEARLDGCVSGSDSKQAALACGIKTKSQYAPLWQAYRALRRSWLATASMLRGYEALGVPPPDEEILSLMGKLARAHNHFREVFSALEGYP